jgi:hypothetical protein
MFRTEDDRPRCPHCRTVADDYTPFDTADPVPTEGAVSLCVYCLGLSIFTGEGLDKRKPTEAELIEIMADPQVIKAIRVLEAWPDRPAPLTTPGDV